jgi:hypothetical protein
LPYLTNAVLHYGSGLPIPAPGNLNNNNNATLLRTTYAQRVPGQPLFLQDLNCHCFDPSTTVVLNANAWTDTPNGQFSPSAAYYNDFRYQRRPAELMSLGRIFRIKERATLLIRAEFNNIFSRTLMLGVDARHVRESQYEPGRGVVEGCRRALHQRLRHHQHDGRGHRGASRDAGGAVPVLVSCT